ncbi:MAG: hypothetical protein IT371_30510 [Deltaproteobacteria bacterium]|nr:hypothetical protein [Deltaproteobacteria bacterium]
MAENGDENLINPGTPPTAVDGTGGTSFDQFAADFAEGDPFSEFDPPPAPAPKARAQREPRAERPAEREAPSLADGVTVTVKTPRARAPQAASEPPPRDPLGWLSNANEGRIRIVRRPGNGVNAEGIATRGKWKGRYVGVGEVGIIDVCSPDELGEQIRSRAGGGNFLIAHIDQNDKKIRDGNLALPQDPQPIEGTSPDDEDEESDDMGGFVIHDEPRQSRYVEPFQQAPQQHQGPLQQQQPQGPFQQQPQQPQYPGGYVAPGGGSGAVWEQPYAGERAKDEVEALREQIEAEREERRKAEMLIEKERHERERERERLERQREQDRLASEMTALKAMIAQQAQAPRGDDPMKLFMSLMMEQSKQQAERWEREARERRERDEREVKERRERDERDRRDREDERKRQEILFQAQQAQNEKFMTMVLGQKQDPEKLIGILDKLRPAGDPLASLETAFAVVERAKTISGGDEGDDEDEDDEGGGVGGALRAAVPTLKTLAEYYMKKSDAAPAAKPQGAPQPPQIPHKPEAKPQPQDTGALVVQVSKLVGLVANGFNNQQEPDKVAAALVGYAAGIGAADRIDEIAASDPVQIKNQLLVVRDMGLPAESVAQIDAFLGVYDKPGGLDWLKGVLAALAE